MVQVSCETNEKSFAWNATNPRAFFVHIWTQNETQIMLGTYNSEFSQPRDTLSWEVSICFEDLRILPVYHATNKFSSFDIWTIILLFSNWTTGYSKQMHLIAFSCPSPPRNCLWRGWQSNSVNLNAATAVSVSATAAVPAFVSVSVSLSVSVSMTCLQVSVDDTLMCANLV